ncbi:RNA helicase [Haplosporangium sp. Z 767]|nr:RNA helicase [Haplosporangium sp. Z 767]
MSKMLSTVAAGRAAAWNARSLWTGRTTSTSPLGRTAFSLTQHTFERSTLSKPATPIVFCRFRHKLKSSGRHTDREPYRETEYGSSRVPKAFGGQEFTTQWEIAALKNGIERFKMPNSMQLHLVSLGTPRDKALELIRNFSNAALRGEIPQLDKKAIGVMANQSLEVGMTFKSMGVTREEAIVSKLDKGIWDAFFTHSEKLLPEETLFRLSRMRDISDMRFPEEWSPPARLMKRKIIMHVGPTNSGKTYQALMRLQAAESGAYLSPLRLLAHEVYERMNNAGTPCNLVTGEERRYGILDESGAPVPEAATVTSCTVEMVDLNRKIEVAVVDEIQMLADPDRGWAWTHALLSLPAQEIHLCGEPTVVELVKNICALTNEEVEVHRYDRLSKLEVDEKSINGRLDLIQKGDCVVTFSRKNIFLLKKAIEAETGLRCAVAYGSLPPESRSMQAKYFNDPKSGYDVLVASDAIGMGLNLNIRRIIFEAVEKFDGSVVRTLSLTQLKQIAGRAGRFGTEYAVGKATTLLQADIPTLKRAVAAPMIDIKRAALQPTAEMIEQFAALMPGAPFSHVLKMFDMLSKNSELFFPGLLRNMISVSVILDHIKLPVRTRIPFISAPIQVRDPMVVEAAVKMATAVSKAKPITIDDIITLPKKDSKEEQQLDLKPLESTHRIIMLYLWLSQRFVNVMSGGLGSDAMKRKARCEVLIEVALKQNEDKRLKKERERMAKAEREQDLEESEDLGKAGRRRRKDKRSTSPALDGQTGRGNKGTFIHHRRHGDTSTSSHSHL